MQKSELQAKFTEAGLTEDVLQAVQEELAAYPEELAVDQLKQFDAFLASLQLGEMEEAHQLEQLADVLEETGRDLENNFGEFTFKSLRAMKTGLSQAQDMASVAEPVAEAASGAQQTPSASPSVPPQSTGMDQPAVGKDQLAADVQQPVQPDQPAQPVSAPDQNQEVKPAAPTPPPVQPEATPN